MYEKIKLSVSLAIGIAESFPLNVVMKQGCKLFNIFVNDINEIFDERFCHPGTLSNIKPSNLFYADDLILISEIRAGLQSTLKICKHTPRNRNLLSIIIRKKSWLWKKTFLSSNAPP